MKMVVDKNGDLVYQDTFMSEEEKKELVAYANHTTDLLFEQMIERCATVKRGPIFFLRKISTLVTQFWRKD